MKPLTGQDEIDPFILSCTSQGWTAADIEMRPYAEKLSTAVHHLMGSLSASPVSIASEQIQTGCDRSQSLSMLVLPDRRIRTRSGPGSSGKFPVVGLAVCDRAALSRRECRERPVFTRHVAQVRPRYIRHESHSTVP